MKIDDPTVFVFVQLASVSSRGDSDCRILIPLKRMNVPGALAHTFLLITFEFISIFFCFAILERRSCNSIVTANCLDHLEIDPMRFLAAHDMAEQERSLFRSRLKKYSKLVVSQMK